MEPPARRLADGVANGENIDQLADRSRKLWVTVSDPAKTIARTEDHQSQHVRHPRNVAAVRRGDWQAVGGRAGQSHTARHM